MYEIMAMTTVLLTISSFIVDKLICIIFTEFSYLVTRNEIWWRIFFPFTPKAQKKVLWKESANIQNMFKNVTNTTFLPWNPKLIGSFTIIY